jgi:lysozyme
MANPLILAALAGVGVAFFKMGAAQSALMEETDSIVIPESVTPDEPAQTFDDVYTSPVHENFGVLDMTMRLSYRGLNRLKERESIGGRFSAKAYPDHKGYSIGYGHLIRPGDGLSPSSVINEAKAAQLLAADVATAESTVRACIDVELTQNQFDALVSFCYNVGVGAFANSTLVRKINAGDDSAAQEFDRWIFASGQVNNGLVSRRESEAEQFLA